MKTNLIETIAIILVIGILLFLPHTGKAQYGAFSYPAFSWGNQASFLFPSFSPGFPTASFAHGLPGTSLSPYYGSN